VSESIIVKKWGEKMNSPRPWRRNLFFVIEPAEKDIIKSLKNVVIELKILLGQWDYDFRSEWWITHKVCPCCKARQEYENSKFIDCEWVWNRRYCMRHYLVYHCNELLSQDNIESNRPIEFSISKQHMNIKLSSNNYDYDVTIHRSHATLNCDYKGNKYTFTYNNHTNSLPYTNTYFVLLKAVCSAISAMQRFLAHLLEQSRAMPYNVYVNSILFVQAK